METDHSPYDFEASIQRIDDILNSQDNVYEEVDTIPARGRLTYENGFYVYCSAIFIDVRGSSELPSKYRRPTLARIYRSFVSEAVSVVRGHPKCAEVNIVGDCVSAIIDSPKRDDVNDVFNAAARLRSLVDILNLRLSKRGIEPIRVGIGLSYGRALMIKAGRKGSAVNDVVWMGDVVNEAAKLCGRAGKREDGPPILLSELIHENLSEYNKGLVAWDPAEMCYAARVHNKVMEAWRVEAGG